MSKNCGINYNHNEIDYFINNTFKKMCPNSRYRPAIHPPVSKIIVLGDIHGDFQLAKEMLTISKLVKFNSDNDYKWIGGNTYVVQVGDQVDRCRPVDGKSCENPKATRNDEASDIKILKLFTELDKQAQKDGGAVISLLGNHELMNANGQLQYVSYEGLREFDNYEDKEKNVKFSSGYEARKYAFSPGNEYGKFLGCNRLPAVIIGSNIFIHAGLVDGLIDEIGLSDKNDFETINVAIRKWLLGLLNKKHVSHIISRSKYSMFWTRILGNIDSNVSMNSPICKKNISQILKILNVGGIIVGHTPQSFKHNEDLNSTCDGKVWRVDNGSSSAFNDFDSKFVKTGNIDHNRRVQYLEIINDKNYKTCDKNKCSFN